MAEKELSLQQPNASQWNSLEYSITFLLFGSVGARAQIGILGLGPYSRIWIHSKRNRWLGKAQSVESRKERVKGYSPRSLSSSDTKNISQADT